MLNEEGVAAIELFGDFPESKFNTTQFRLSWDEKCAATGFPALTRHHDSQGFWDGPSNGYRSGEV